MCDCVGTFTKTSKLNTYPANPRRVAELRAVLLHGLVMHRVIVGRLVAG